MEFLKDLEFTPEEITEVINNTPEKITNAINENIDLVTENINFIKELGVTNYKEVVTRYADMFLMDDTNFKAIFQKYDRADLVEKIAKNVAIIEHL